MQIKTVGSDGASPRYGVIDLTNTLQQDLYLLAKGVYDVEGKDMRDVARHVCGVHILSTPLGFRDTCFWLMKEFVHPGILFKSIEDFSNFILDVGRDPWLGVKDLPYYEMLCHALLSKIRSKKVMENDEFLFPFPRPERDPRLHELLQRMDHYDA